MEKAYTALVVGASGLVGTSLVKQLLANTAYGKVRILVRKPLTLSHPKLEQQVVNFDNLKVEDCVADHVFCTLGTTIKKAGSKEAFRQVDYVYPLRVAELAKQAGVELFAIVTSLGASASSSIFYSRVKGEVEQALQQLNFSSLGIFQPSMLVGDRKEARLGEEIGQRVMRWFDFLTPLQYKAIHVDKVAAAMIRYALHPPKGVTVIKSGAMH